VPVAATEKVAACPVVTAWLAGCAVIDGAAPTNLLEPEVRPTHPVLVASKKVTKTRPKRFMVQPQFSRNLLQGLSVQSRNV
jgi:hypothetical protein